MNVPAISLALAASLVALVAVPALAPQPQLAARPATQVAGTPATDDGAETADARASAAFVPVAHVSSLMNGIGMAFSRVREMAGKPDEEYRFARLSASAEVVAELSNVNTLHGKQQAYRDMAASTRGIALELARAARADTVDESQIAALIDRLDTSCSTCHDAEF